METGDNLTDRDSGYTKEYFSGYVQTSRVLGRPHGDKRTYRYWMRFLRKHLARGSSVLEIGCGLGFFAKLAQEHYDYIGTDISETALTFAREQHAIRKVQFVDAGEPLPFPGDTFDAIVAFDVVEHLREPAILFAEAARVLRPGGLLVVSTPNTRSLGIRMKKNSKDLVASMYCDDTHVSLLDRDTWLSLISDSGMVIVREGTGHLWDTPYVTWCPTRLQHLILLPLNRFIEFCAGTLPWSLGENLIIVARRP